MPTKKATDDHDAAGMSVSKRKRVKVKTGQLVAVPLCDGTHALLHVARYDGDLVGAHYAYRRSAPQQLLERHEDAMAGGPIAILAITANRVRDGYWPVIGYREPDYPAEVLDMKGSSYTAGVSPDLFEAYWGLRPWDEMADPHCYEKMLLPGVPVPPTVRYKRDFPPDAAASPAAPATSAVDESGPEVTEGPAEIHIEIKYPGDALPSIELLHRRQALERALDKAGAGEVTDAGGGGGVMDIHLHTHDARRSMPLVVAAVKEAGFEPDAKIEVEALDALDSEE